MRSLMENTLTIPSIVTLTTRSPSSGDPPLINCTPILTVVCWPNRTIFVPARQSQHTRALSAPAETKFLEDRATARIPFKCPANCWRGLKVTDEKRWTRLQVTISNFSVINRVPLTQRHGSRQRRPLIMQSFQIQNPRTNRQSNTHLHQLRSLHS